MEVCNGRGVKREKTDAAETGCEEEMARPTMGIVALKTVEIKP